MNRFNLPKSIEIEGQICEINTDFRDILSLFELFNEPDLLDEEKIGLALQEFYCNDNYLTNVQEAIDGMMYFINAGDNINSGANTKPLYDWEQDFNLIVSPVNKTLGFDIRGIEYLHWWTFLSAFMEIGECTFSTYVGIRNKLNKGKKLDDWEKSIYKENRDRIVLKKKYDNSTQQLIDSILGRG